MTDVVTPRPPRHGSRPRIPLLSRRGDRSWIAVLLLTASCLIRTAPGQTTVTFDTFGLGNAYRPGGPVAARVVVTSDLDAPVPGLVEWEIPNPDGDRQINQRTIEIPSRGGTATTWLLGDLPSRIDPLDVAAEPWIVRVFEYRDGRRIEEITSARLDPSVCGARPIDQSKGIAVVIGPNEAGLGGFTPIPGRDGRPGLNELLEVVGKVEPPDLPDSWPGLEQADVIVWTADDPRFQPGNLGTRLTVEGAIRSWLERGGHLVIALPRSGDPWRLQRGDGVLDDLLAGVTPITDSNYPLQQALPALSDRPGLRDPDRTITLHRFDPATLPAAWRPLAGFEPSPPPFDPSSVSIPEGTPANVAEALIESARRSQPRPTPVIHAIRRNVGLGTLDVLGIDPSDPDIRVQQPQGLPSTWVFWNPILGRRTFTPPASVVDALAERRELAQISRTSVLGSRRLISSRIGQRGSANGGVLMAMMLFGGYWLLAGPIGFIILGRLGRRRHAWLAFTATSVVAAGLGWLLGELAVVTGSPLRHLTVLRHHYVPESAEVEPPLDHAICWFSARLPGYGTAEVSVGARGDVATTAAAGTDLLAHFSPPPNGFEAGFLDAARYEVDTRRRHTVVAPARATSAEFVADWMGRPDTADGIWNSTIKVDPTDPISLEMLDRDLARISGTLVNGTGVTLSEILILVISPVRPAPLPLDDRGLPTIPGVAEAMTSQMPNVGSILAVTMDGWAPGVSLPLGGPSGVFGASTRFTQFGRFALGDQFDARFPAEDTFGSPFDGPAMPETSFERRLQSLSFFQSLAPPPLVQSTDGGRSASRFTRLLGRDLDLSRSLVEPGVVVLAFADEAPCPVPIDVDGTRLEGEGTVLLQWIHPLPSDASFLVPPRPAEFDETAESTQASAGSRPSHPFHPQPHPTLTSTLLPRGVATAWR